MSRDLPTCPRSRTRHRRHAASHYGHIFADTSILARHAALLYETKQRIRNRRRYPPQGVGVAVIERRRAAPDRQVDARDVGPAAVVVEGDVDAVVVGAERLLEEAGRADPEAGIAALGFHRDRL